MKIHKKILGCCLCLMMICGCGENVVPQESTHQETVELDKVEETTKKRRSDRGKRGRQRAKMGKTI